MSKNSSFFENLQFLRRMIPHNFLQSFYENCIRGPSLPDGFLLAQKVPLANCESELVAGIFNPSERRILGRFYFSRLRVFQDKNFRHLRDFPYMNIKNKTTLERRSVYRETGFASPLVAHSTTVATWFCFRVFGVSFRDIFNTFHSSTFRIPLKFVHFAEYPSNCSCSTKTQNQFHKFIYESLFKS